MLRTVNTLITIRDGTNLQYMLMHRLTKISIIYRQAVRHK